MNFKLSDDGREPSSSSVDQDQNNNKKNDNTTTDGQSSSTSSTQQQKLQQPKVPISVLPQEVVDQIAAGEVVQRPASVVKELLENCLDAGSTHIIIHVERGGLQKLVVTDNGCGITKDDLALAATRHATSKLSTIQDFKTLQTFGFRGEALASMSMVSKLTITSRTTDSPVGYTQSYKNGTPISNTTASSSSKSSTKVIRPKPCARKVGTTITIQDLFYNVPHRRNTYSKRESDEYNKILQVVQYYAIHYADQAAFCCERVRFTGGGGGGKSKTVLVDLNTSQLSHVKQILNNNNNNTATTTTILRPPDHQIHTVKKQVIAHIFDTNVEQHLSYLECTQQQQQQQQEQESLSSSSPPTSSEIQKEGGGGGANKELEFQVTCKAYYSSPSYESCKPSSSTATKFVIFLNHRLVEIPILKRTIEDVYGEFTKSKKSIVVLDIEVPGAQVDVNVHPSKKQVALMYQDEILTLIGTKLRERLQSHGQSFQIQSVAPTSKNHNNNKKKKAIQNPYTTTSSNNNNRKKSSSTKEDDDPEITTTTPEKTNNQSSKKRKSVVDGDDSSNSSSSSKKKKKTPPSQLVRTSNATPVGAIEPFLVPMPKPSQLSQQQLSQQHSMTQSSTEEEEALSPSPSTTNTNDETADRLTHSPSSSVSSSQRQQQQQQQQHKTGCPLANVDLSQPGVFASISKCLCNQILLKQPISIMRPKKVIPTKCSYSSVASLRKRVNKHLSDTMTKQIREGYFVGVVSYQRSLIQCGEELVLINHFELSKVLFYQLALARFGGAKMAHLGRLSSSTAAGGEGHDPAMQGLNIHTLISQALQLEDTMVSMTNDGSITNSDNRNCDLVEEQPPASSCPDFDLDEETHLLPVNNTNRKLAADATACLLENAEMLKDYFSIRIEKSKQSSSRTSNSTCKNQDGNAEDGSYAGRSGDDDDDRNRAILTGLPILLDGHMPQSHGLGIFLLRLATQVNWREERPCFQGVCKEIGNFYAMLPPCERNVDEELISYIRHTLFPALSYLLLPSERLSSQGYFTVMTKLSTLYKVFERC